jgi:hypothetical protein
MPSQSLLNEFNRFDDETLEKLIVIADSILSPLDTELTSVDYASMLKEVFKPNGLADRYYPEWTDRSKSDFGRFLVELFALFSDKNMFYINHFSREGFVGVAELYRSIFHQALHQGFNPPSNVASEGDVELVFSPGTTEFVPRGSIVLGIQDMPDLTYINKPFTIPASVIDQNMTVEFMHGKLRREQVFFDGHSIVIDTPNIVNKSVDLIIDNVSWTETDNFLLGTIATKHFMVFYDEKGKAEIMFAKDNLGAVPDENQVCVIEYVTGGGYAGDIMDNTVNLVVNSQTTRNLLSYTQFAMVGGNDLQPLENLRQTVIGKARHQNRVVTPEDAEYFCKELTFVEKVFADVFLNYTYIYVLPSGGGNITPAQINLVEAKLLPNLLMGFNLTVGSPIYVPVTIDIDIYLAPNTIRSGANIVAQQTVEEFLNPLKKGEFGAGVNRSLLINKILQRVKGSQNVTFPTLHRSGTPQPPDDLVFIGQELVDFDNSTININLIGGI